MNLRTGFSPALAFLFLAGAIPLPAQAQVARAVPDALDAPAVFRGVPGNLSVHPADDDEFAQMDADRDGRISADEYAASPRQALERIAARKRSGSTGPSDLNKNEGRPGRAEFFRRLDTDGDGFISRRELDAANQSSGGLGKR